MLIDGERDDNLEAEDQAIRDQARPPEPDGQQVTGIPQLIEDVFSETPVQREGQG